MPFRSGTAKTRTATSPSGPGVSAAGHAYAYGALISAAGPNCKLNYMKLKYPPRPRVLYLPISIRRVWDVPLLAQASRKSARPGPWPRRHAQLRAPHLSLQAVAIWPVAMAISRRPGAQRTRIGGFRCAPGAPLPDHHRKRFPGGRPCRPASLRRPGHRPSTRIPTAGPVILRGPISVSARALFKQDLHPATPPVLTASTCYTHDPLHHLLLPQWRCPRKNLESQNNLAGWSQ